MRRRDLRAAGLLARTELAAMVRRVRGNRRQLIAAGFALLQFAVVLPLLGLSRVLDFGHRLVVGEVPLGTLGAIATAAAVTGGYVGGASAIDQNRVGSVGPLIRTSVAPSAVTVGRIASELARTSVVFAPPIVVLLGLVGVGAATPLAPFLLGLVVGPSLLAGTFLGRLLGSSARYLGVLSGLSAWARAIAFLAGMVLLFLASQVFLQSFLSSTTPVGPSISITAFLPGTPVQAYAGVFLAPLGTPVRPIGVLAVLVVVLAIPLGLAATIRLETALLLRDDVEDAETAASGSRRVPSAFAITPSTRVAWRHLLRTARDPKSLGHLMPLLFGGLGGGIYWVTRPDALVTLGPPAAVVLGSLLAGMAYCLNPLGDDREQLPLLLSSVRSTGVLLRGRAAAGCAVGLVVAVGLGTPLAVLGWPPRYAVGQTLLAPVLVVAAAGAALGLGGLLPTFERREYMNVERAHPSQVALLGFLFAWSIVAAACLFLLVLTVEGELSVPIAVGAWLVSLGGLAAVGYGGYRYALGRFDALTLDDV